jgi:hypothetical protein
VDVLVATINAAVVAAVGLILGWLGKGRIDKLEAHIDRLDERINRVEGRLFLGFDSIRSDPPGLPWRWGCGRRPRPAAPSAQPR